MTDFFQSSCKQPGILTVPLGLLPLSTFFTWKAFVSTGAVSPLAKVVDVIRVSLGGAPGRFVWIYAHAARVDDTKVGEGEDTGQAWVFTTICYACCRYESAKFSTQVCGLFVYSTLKTSLHRA